MPIIYNNGRLGCQAQQKQLRVPPMLGLTAQPIVYRHEKFRHCCNASEVIQASVSRTFGVLHPGLINLGWLFRVNTYISLYTI